MNKISERQREDEKEIDSLYKKLGDMKLQQYLANKEKKGTNPRTEMTIPDKIKDEIFIDEGKIEELEKEKAFFKQR
jgi:hypothetical protein